MLIPIGFFGGGGIGAPYWISILDSGNQDFGNGVGVDPNGNVYLGGTFNYTGTNNGSNSAVAKYNSSGVIQWQRYLSNGKTTCTDIAVDTSGNVYLGGQGYSTTDGSNGWGQFAKYSTTGSIQWQRRFYTGGTYGGPDVHVDTSGNLFANAYQDNNGASNNFGILKYNTSGVLQFQRYYGGSGMVYGSNITTDSSGNIYASGSGNYGSTDGGILIKMDSSGTLQWQRRMHTDAQFSFGPLATDSAGNVYVSGSAYITGNSGAFLMKYDSSGTLLWQRRIGTTTNEYPTGLAVDPTNNIYLFGATAASRNMFIVKFDSSGSAVWQRTLGSSVTDNPSKISIDVSGNLYISGTYNSNERAILAKLPADGSKTGTYSVNGISFTYTTSALSISTSGLSGSTPSLGSGASGLTDAATSLGDSAATMTSTTTTI